MRAGIGPEEANDSSLEQLQDWANAADERERDKLIAIAWAFRAAQATEESFRAWLKAMS